MEVRVLTEMEIYQAAELAVSVYNYCLRQSVFPQNLTDTFLQYAEAGHLMRMLQEGKLKLWGIWNGGQLCAMSAMQTEGHITMLYVHPAFQRRGFGRRLLLEMRKYAAESGNLPTVTVNAMPAWTAGYFERQGFGRMTVPGYGSTAFVPMSVKSIKEVKYCKKPMNGTILAGVVGGFTGLIVFVGAAFMTYYLLIH
jgi:GNAT superfamily N-acetyltransferase